MDGSVREEDALDCGVGERKAGGGVGYGHYWSFTLFCGRSLEKWLMYKVGKVHVPSR